MPQCDIQIKLILLMLCKISAAIFKLNGAGFHFAPGQFASFLLNTTFMLTAISIRNPTNDKRQLFVRSQQEPCPWVRYRMWTNQPPQFSPNHHTSVVDKSHTFKFQPNNRRYKNSVNKQHELPEYVIWSLAILQLLPYSPRSHKFKRVSADVR